MNITSKSLLGLLGDVATASDERNTLEPCLAAFRGVVPGDYYSAIYLDPQHHVAEIFHEDQGWLPTGHPLIEIIQATHSQHPTMQKFYSDGRSGVFVRSQIIPDREWKRTELYEVERSLGFEDATVLCQRTASGRVLVISCGRKRKFSVGDVEPATQFQKILGDFSLFRSPQLPTQQTSCKQVAKELEMLTRRENEVLEWVREGKRNSEIALILGISGHTVRHHLENIFVKLGVETRAAAANAIGG